MPMPIRRHRAFRPSDLLVAIIDYIHVTIRRDDGFAEQIKKYQSVRGPIPCSSWASPASGDGRTQKAAHPCAIKSKFPQAPAHPPSRPARAKPPAANKLMEPFAGRWPGMPWPGAVEGSGGGDSWLDESAGGLGRRHKARRRWCSVRSWPQPQSARKPKKSRRGRSKRLNPKSSLSWARTNPIMRLAATRAIA